jgi:CubicO group peptidase (beta-lactamase class C family)
LKTVVLAAGACALLFPAVNASAVTKEEALASRFRAAGALIDARLAKEAVPGAAIGVVHDQSLVWSHRYGVESLETRAPVTDDTLFSICSISKLFTGVAVMNLVEDGKLSLDAPITSYVGVVPSDTTGAEEPATVRNLLSHVSGVPREPVEDVWADNSFPDHEQLRATIAAQSQLYRPYDYWQYSNLGMAMLGEAVASVSGQPWGTYVDETILSPLGMDRTTTDMPFDRVGAGFARGYFVRSPEGKRQPVPPHQFRAFAPAAGVASSVNDMAKFASWNFRLRDRGGEEVLKATTLKQMQRVHWVGADFDEPAWGLAFAATRYGDKTLWGHGGYCPGTRASFVMRLPSKIGIVMMATANDVSPEMFVKQVYALTADAVEAVHGEKATEEAAAKPKDGAVALADYEGYYAVENYDWDLYVGFDEDGLFILPVFDDDPVKGMLSLKHESGDRFRRKRKDDTLAEPVVFERNAEGRVTALVHHSYRHTKRQGMPAAR